MKLAFLGDGRMGSVVMAQARASGHAVGVVLNINDAGLAPDALVAKLRGHDAAIDFSAPDAVLGHVAACVNGYSLYRETSFLAPRMGQCIASELVTLVDDGRRPGGLGSRPFDGEGLPTSMVNLDRTLEHLTRNGFLDAKREGSGWIVRLGSAAGSGPT